MSSTFPKFPLLGNPQVTINMNNKQNKNSKFKPSIVQWAIPICNLPCKSQKQCNLHVPLTSPPPPLYSRFHPQNPCGILEKWNVVIIQHLVFLTFQIQLLYSYFVQQPMVLHLLLILYFWPPLPLTYSMVPSITTLPLLLEWFPSILILDPKSYVVIYLLDLLPWIFVVP
jgi:hypothetical protein